MAILQFDEVHRALPVTKGISLKSGKLNEQSLRKRVLILVDYMGKL
jgi:hypothetical protein